MDLEEKKALFLTSLERAAEKLGDITPHVMERYYAKLPKARDDFEYHQRGNPEKLEGEMVEQTLYCLMEWFNSPFEIEIILTATIPHHIDTLNIGEEHFCALFETVTDTIMATIPAEAHRETEIWTELRKEIAEITDREFAHCRKVQDPA